MLVVYQLMYCVGDLCTRRCDSSALVCVFQAEDGIRELVRSRGLGDVYKRQLLFRQGDRRRQNHVGALSRPDRRCGAGPRGLLSLSLIHI